MVYTVASGLQRVRKSTVLRKKNGVEREKNCLLRKVQTGCGGHTPPYSLGTEVISRGKEVGT